MKKLALTTLLLLSVIVLSAQRHDRPNSMKELSPEQAATLDTKRMTLALDLDESQQKTLKPILLEQAALRTSKMEERRTKRASGTPATKEERFTMQNERLDHMIAHKAKIKKLLTAEQFTKWEKMQKTRGKDKHKGKNKPHRKG